MGRAGPTKYEFREKLACREGPQKSYQNSGARHDFFAGLRASRLTPIAWLRSAAID